MKKTEKIWLLVTGNRKGNKEHSILSEIEANKDSQSEFNELKNTWALLSSMKEMPSNEVDELYSRFKEQIPPQSFSLRSLFSHYSKYAAILVMGMILSYLSINIFNIPGDSAFVKEKYTTVIADKEQISKIVLPDSTVVWINSESKITYNSKFSVNNRNIELVGQAYFHAAKNKKIPLVVSAGELEVNVLGTKFDVCAFPENGNIRVILESGKVHLNSKNKKSFDYELSPGEMATYYPSNNKVVTKKVESQWYTSWKEGILIFKEDPMSVVISALQHRYNIDIEVKNPEIYNSVFNAKIGNEPLDKVLRSIEFSCSLKATIIRDSGSTNSKLKVVLSK